MENEESKHISSQMEEKLSSLRSRLMEMGGMVEEQVENAIQAFMTSDATLAQDVRDTDRLVNRLEVEIDDDVANVLALRHPVATDLRLVIAVSKAVNDLERIGDEASKIAKVAIKYAEEGFNAESFVEVKHIGDKALVMLREALNAFTRMDAESALVVVKSDKEIDHEHKTAIRSLVTLMMEDPRNISKVIEVISTLRSLERIGDHAKNICEDVIYLSKGKDVRHTQMDVVEQVVEGE